MTDPICVRCGRPLADGAYCCSLCASQAAEKLALVVEVTPAARDVAQGLSRRSQGGASGKPGSRLPLDLIATAKLDSVSNAIYGWARHVSEARGVELPQPPEPLDPMIGPLCRTRYECTHDSCKIMRDGDEWGWDMIAAAAQFLVGQVEWMRHRQEVDEFLTDVEACLRVVRSIARGPQESKYLGPCGAARSCEGLLPDDWPEGDCGIHTPHPAHDREPCEGDVYGRVGAQNGTCRTCGATVDQDERRAWLDDEARQHSYTAAEIADAYPIKANTIRQWLARGLLVAHGELSGRPLLNLGEVLDLAAGDAARREEARARRERRAAKTAESERVA